MLREISQANICGKNNQDQVKMSDVLGFNCESCGRRYSSKGNLTRHIRERHNADLEYYKCDQKHCGNQFIRRSYLRHHLHKVHGFSDIRAKQRSYCAKPEIPSRYDKYNDISDDESLFEVEAFLRQKHPIESARSTEAVPEIPASDTT